MDNKEFAKVILLNKHFEKTDINKLVEKCAADVRECWEQFVVDELYKLYEQDGYTRILQISKQDFRAFLIWALPKYKEEVLSNDK